MTVRIIVGLLSLIVGLNMWHDGDGIWRYIGAGLLGAAYFIATDRGVVE